MEYDTKTKEFKISVNAPVSIGYYKGFEVTGFSWNDKIPKFGINIDKSWHRGCQILAGGIDAGVGFIPLVKDHDIEDTLQAMLNTLNANYDVLTSFDLYVKEIESSILRFGPRHTDDFWKENVRAFEMDDFKYIKELIELLSSEDEETVRVACFDLSAFACYYPNGRK